MGICSILEPKAAPGEDARDQLRFALLEGTGPAIEVFERVFHLFLHLCIGGAVQQRDGNGVINCALGLNLDFEVVGIGHAAAAWSILDEAHRSRRAG